MTGHVDRLLIRIVRIAADVDDHIAIPVLQWTLSALETRQLPSRIDAMGAPILRSDWEVLRLAVKAIVHDIGVERTAAQFGISPASLKDAINRTREPGAGRKARFLQVVVDNTPANLPARRGS